jgi:ribose transport system substrate-binding protein
MVATLTPDVELGTATARVALRMLEGDGVKINTVLSEPYLVTQSNLDQVWKPSYKEGSPAGAVPPPGWFMPDAYLDGFFAHRASS